MFNNKSQAGSGIDYDLQFMAEDAIIEHETQLVYLSHLEPMELEALQYSFRDDIYQYIFLTN